jgi:REP element-mobilizing transposase RayT
VIYVNCVDFSIVHLGIEEKSMHDWQCLSHVRWDCKYHVVIVPKYRKKVIYGKLRSQVGPILSKLCQQRGITLLEAHAMPDHIHMCLSLLLASSVSLGLAPLRYSFSLSTWKSHSSVSARVRASMSSIHFLVKTEVTRRLLISW